MRARRMLCSHCGRNARKDVVHSNETRCWRCRVNSDWRTDPVARVFVLRWMKHIHRLRNRADAQQPLFQKERADDE